MRTKATMTVRLRRIGACVAFAASCALASEAGAITCKEWNRLSSDKRTATVEAMIDQRVQSNAGRKYHVSKTALRRCLLDHTTTIEDSFDDVCSDSRAGMQALDDAMRTHVYDCVGPQ
jgi:hypothetical protein